MRILLFGKNGQVGWELNRSLQSLGDVIALAREDADFTNPESLRNIVREISPAVIVNAVAYTAVDKAEDEEELATTINGVAPGVLAEEAKNINALLVHYSTDYVFDGTKNDFYVETDTANPVNVYGKTKLAGDASIQSSGCDFLIFRISWVYASRGSNFLLTMLKLASEREELSVIVDQVGAPTTAKLIAHTTAICIRQATCEQRSGVFSSGLYHLAASGSTNWHGFAKEIVDIANNKLGLQAKVKSIKAISTSDYPTPAKRPMNSRLALKKLESTYSVTMPDWKKSLLVCMLEL